MGRVQENVKYEEFERLHVVRKLRVILGNWWGVQLNFTDPRGFLRGVPQGKFFNPANPLCQFITERDDGFCDCRNEAKRTTSRTLESGESRIGRCHAGFSTLTLPIQLGDTPLGCAFADGFLHEKTADEQREQVRAYLASRFPSDSAALERFVNSVPVLTEKDVRYMTELVELIIEEVVTLHKQQSDLGEKLQSLSQELHGRYDLGNMVMGTSPSMQQVYRLLTRVSASDATILITGENGTGKEGIARAVHYNSRRRNENFVVQNCGALNDNLLESELFGHVKGAFTNAIRDKKGLFELADRGTLFLDEIGDTSPAMQVKLLRIIQEGTFTPVGGTEQKHVDVRILAATNKDLQVLVKEGTFREDLYYRLNVINIQLPPLRERKEDIPMLTTKFLEDFARQTKSSVKRLSPACLQAMEGYSWPGNIRELQNEVERLCVLAGEDVVIEKDLLSDRILHFAPQEEKYPGLRTEGKLKDSIEELERRMILDSLIQENWNKSRVAKKLGISRAGLLMKCEKFGFDKDERFK